MSEANRRFDVQLGLEPQDGTVQESDQSEN